MGSIRLGKGLRLGRRGLVLILFGLVWILIGRRIFFEPRYQFSQGNPDSLVVLSVMDNPLWGFLWIICGAGAVIVGFLRTHRPFCGRDAIGFNLISIPVFLWTTFFIISWVLSFITDGGRGQSSAYYGMLLYGVIFGLITTLAGWPEGMDETQLENNTRTRRRAARHRKTSS